MRKKLLTAVIVVSCSHSISRSAQSVLATPTTIHFVEISEWSTHDTMNYSDAPAKLDELQASHGFLKCRKNSRAELVPSPRAYARNGAWRRWLGDDMLKAMIKWEIDALNSQRYPMTENGTCNRKILVCVGCPEKEHVVYILLSIHCLQNNHPRIFILTFRMSSMGLTQL